MVTILQIIYRVEILKEVHSISFKASLADGNVCVIDVKNVDVIYDVICHVCAVGEETWFGCVWNGMHLIYSSYCLAAVPTRLLFLASGAC